MKNYITEKVEFSCYLTTFYNLVIEIVSNTIMRFDYSFQFDLFPISIYITLLLSGDRQMHHL